VINVKISKDWTSEHIENFWSWLSTTERKEKDYFAYQVGYGIHNLLRKKIKLQGDYLDYGCGLGHLFPYFSNSGMNCHGVEFSASSVAEVNKRYKLLKGFFGTVEVKEIPIEYPDNKFDLITFIETIEHLNEYYLPITLNELHRLLKPGGTLLLTTPFNENLSDNHIYCPFCNSEFHRMQHMNSFNVENITELLEKHNFKVLYCAATNLYVYSPSIKTKIITQIKTIAKRHLNKTGANYKLMPHLVTLMTKE
jgi:cyclopropane fatty-acyl-phospholipid synthase-like methyltransferase